LLVVRRLALLSVYDKTGLLPFAKGLKELGFRLLGSGGTAKQIREAGMDIEYGGRAFLANPSCRAD
jgi:AICAR transformylase/IMP cyclohydrolase PurH